jgi:hypothetical protein
LLLLHRNKQPLGVVACELQDEDCTLVVVIATFVEIIGRRTYSSGPKRGVGTSDEDESSKRARLIADGAPATGAFGNAGIDLIMNDGPPSKATGPTPRSTVRSGGASTTTRATLHAVSKGVARKNRRAFVPANGVDKHRAGAVNLTQQQTQQQRPRDRCNHPSAIKKYATRRNQQDEFECKICLEVRDSVPSDDITTITGCFHHFCYSCLNELVQLNSTACPLC